MMVFLCTPVMRTMEWIEQPSVRAEITASFFSVLRIFTGPKVPAPNPTSERDKLVQPIKHLTPKVGMNSDTFTLDEGQVILQWPAKMSHESYEDFKSWLELVSRKAKRAADKYSDDLVE